MSISALILSLTGVAALVLLTVTGSVGGEVTVPIIATIVGAGAGRVAESARQSDAGRSSSGGS